MVAARSDALWGAAGGAEIVAIRAYERSAAYQAIAARVRADPQSLAAQEYRRHHLDPLVTEGVQRFMSSTVPLQATALAHLCADFIDDGD